MIKDLITAGLQNTLTGLLLIIIFTIIVLLIRGVIALCGAALEYNKIIGSIVILLIFSFLIGSFADAW